MTLELFSGFDISLPMMQEIASSSNINGPTQLQIFISVLLQWLLLADKVARRVRFPHVFFQTIPATLICVDMS